MNSKSKEILMGIVACVLLLIYAIALGDIILSVCKWDPDAGEFVIKVNVVWVVTLTGGIVSAVVIANLATSDPGETPISQVSVIADAYGKKLIQSIVWVYITVWMVMGIAAFYVGVIKLPEVSGTLNEWGKSWLGIIVGALYAWFGIRKPERI